MSFFDEVKEVKLDNKVIKKIEGPNGEILYNKQTIVTPNITLTANKNFYYTYENIILNGVLSYNGIGISNVPVDIYEKQGYPASYKPLQTVYTQSDGTFSMTINANDTYYFQPSFKAIYQGNESYEPVETPILNINDIRYEYIWPNEVTSGSEITLIDNHGDKEYYPNGYWDYPHRIDVTNGYLTDGWYDNCLWKIEGEFRYNSSNCFPVIGFWDDFYWYEQDFYWYGQWNYLSGFLLRADIDDDGLIWNTYASIVEDNQQRVSASMDWVDFTLERINSEEIKFTWFEDGNSLIFEVPCENEQMTFGSVVNPEIEYARYDYSENVIWMYDDMIKTGELD